VVADTRLATRLLGVSTSFTAASIRSSTSPGGATHALRVTHQPSQPD
jgi:hypothetical protein